VASLTHETKPRNGWRLRAYHAADSSRRFSIWLGEIPAREAQTIQRHVEAVIDSQKFGTPMPGETQRWLGKIHEALRTKLTPVLGTARSVTQAVDQYLAWAAREHKPSTVAAIESTLRQFGHEFGRSQMRSLAAEDVDRWLFTRNVAANTTAKHAKHLKTWIAWCRRCGFVDGLELKTSSAIRRGDKDYISQDLFTQLVDAMPDRYDRAALGIARWSGIRVPSELGILTNDIDWDKRTLTIEDRKRSKRASRGPPMRRVMPLYPELVPWIELVWDHRNEYLLPPIGGGGELAFAARVRSRRDRLGLTWPRLFHSLRATRETELIAQFGMHAACEWIGNSASVAREFYELITDETWAKAKGNNSPS
jgi:integrase